MVVFRVIFYSGGWGRGYFDGFHMGMLCSRFGPHTLSHTKFGEIGNLSGTKYWKIRTLSHTKFRKSVYFHIPFPEKPTLSHTSSLKKDPLSHALSPKGYPFRAEHPHPSWGVTPRFLQNFYLRGTFWVKKFSPLVGIFFQVFNESFLAFSPQNFSSPSPPPKSTRSELLGKPISAII